MCLSTKRRMLNDFGSRSWVAAAILGSMIFTMVNTELFGCLSEGVLDTAFVHRDLRGRSGYKGLLTSGRMQAAEAFQNFIELFFLLLVGLAAFLFSGVLSLLFSPAILSKRLPLVVVRCEEV